MERHYIFYGILVSTFFLFSSLGAQQRPNIDKDNFQKVLNQQVVLGKLSEVVEVSIIKNLDKLSAQHLKQAYTIFAPLIPNMTASQHQIINNILNVASSAELGQLIQELVNVPADQIFGLLEEIARNNITKPELILQTIKNKKKMLGLPQ